MRPRGRGRCRAGIPRHWPWQTSRRGSCQGRLSGPGRASRQAPTQQTEQSKRHIVTTTVVQPLILCGGSGTRLWPLSR
ncbi:MAG: hypothetical protein EKK45_27790, partial [Curvibacter sp.]